MRVVFLMAYLLSGEASADYTKCADLVEAFKLHNPMRISEVFSNGIKDIEESKRFGLIEQMNRLDGEEFKMLMNNANFICNNTEHKRNLSEVIDFSLNMGEGK